MAQLEHPYDASGGDQAAVDVRPLTQALGWGDTRDRGQQDAAEFAVVLLMGYGLGNPMTAALGLEPRIGTLASDLGTSAGTSALFLSSLLILS